MLRQRPRLPATAAALLLILAAGCLYPVREKVDAVACDLAARPRDLSAAPPEGASLIPPAQARQAKDAGILPASYLQTLGGAGQTGSGGRDAPTRPSTPGPKAGVEGGFPSRLTIPPDLPGGRTPPLSFPRGPGNEAARREAVDRQFPPIPPVGPDPVPAPGPAGHPMTLTELEKLALSESPLIVQAAANVKAAEGAALQAGLWPNPTVGYEGNTIGGANSAGQQGGFVEQTIKTANKLQLARAAATMDLKNARLALRRAEYDLLRSVRQQYFAVLVARENVRASGALNRLITEIYNVQLENLRAGGFVAGYEPAQVRALVFQTRGALITARNSYLSAWKQLAAAAGVPALPPTELAGRLDVPLPAFDHADVLRRVLAGHTDVATAENAVQKARFNLKLAQVTPVGDVNVRVMVQRDYVDPPNSITPSVVVSTPLPVWDRNQGGVIEAQARLINAQEEPHRVRDELTGRVAQAYATYASNRELLDYYRREILPSLVQAYQGLYGRYNVEAGGAGVGGPLGGATPQFTDVVVGQQSLAGSVGQYVTTLGAAWQSVVELADLLQADELFTAGSEGHCLQEVAPLPDFDHLPPIRCCHPCSPLPDPRLKGADTSWPPAEAGQYIAPTPPAPGRAAPAPQPDGRRPADRPPAGRTPGRRPETLPPELPLAQGRPPGRVKIATAAPPGVDPLLLEPPPPMPGR